MSQSRYEAYKDSGVAWLGQVPAHWEVKRAKWLFKKMSRPVSSSDEVVTCFRDGIVTLRKNRRLEGFTEANIEHGYQGIHAGDLVIHGMDAFAGAIGVSDSNGKSTPVYIVCEPNPDVDAWFYAHLLRVMAKRNWILALAKGIRERSTDFRYDTFGSQELPLPPLAEQQAIAAFLDRECARIDALVAAQQRMIALSKEKCQALIAHVVTQGLDPAAPRKDSGVAWLGQVPAHWEVKKSKYLCRIQAGDKDTVNSAEDGLYPFYVRSETIERINSFTFNCEAILTAGDGAGVGKVFHHHLTGPFDFHQRVYMMNNFNSITGKFFYYYFSNNFHKIALEGGAKSTVDSLRRPMITNFEICVPPLAEQQAIAAFLDRECARIDALIGKAEQAIVLLRERRSALIAAAVTGQIRVDGVV